MKKKTFVFVSFLIIASFIPGKIYSQRRVPSLYLAPYPPAEMEHLWILEISQILSEMEANLLDKSMAEIGSFVLRISEQIGLDVGKTRHLGYIVEDIGAETCFRVLLRIENLSYASQILEALPALSYAFSQPGSLSLRLRYLMAYGLLSQTTKALFASAAAFFVGIPKEDIPELTDSAVLFPAIGIIASYFIFPESKTQRIDSISWFSLKPGIYHDLSGSFAPGKQLYQTTRLALKVKVGAGPFFLYQDNKSLSHFRYMIEGRLGKARKISFHSGIDFGFEPWEAKEIRINWYMKF